MTLVRFFDRGRWRGTFSNHGGLAGQAAEPERMTSSDRTVKAGWRREVKREEAHLERIKWMLSFCVCVCVCLCRQGKMLCIIWWKSILSPFLRPFPHSLSARQVAVTGGGLARRCSRWPSHDKLLIGHYLRVISIHVLRNDGSKAKDLFILNWGSNATFHPFTISSWIFRNGSPHSIWSPITSAQCVSLWNKDIDQFCAGVKLSRLCFQSSIFSLFTHHFSWVQVSATTIYYYFPPCSETFRKVILVEQCGSMSIVFLRAEKHWLCA